MAKYGVQVTDELALEIDAGPGCPRLSGLELDFDTTEVEVADVIHDLGGVSEFALNATGPLQVRYGLRLTRDGEDSGRVTLRVWVRGEEPEPAPVRFPAVKALMDGRADGY